MMVTFVSQCEKKALARTRTWRVLDAFADRIGDNAVAHYALEGLPNKVLVAEYKTLLPDVESIAKAINEVRHGLGVNMKKRSDAKPVIRKHAGKLK